MLSVFGDESCDETGQRTFAVSGVMGTQEQWDTLEPAWLERTKGKVFHATDCESDQGEYEGIDHKDNLKLYADLVNIITKTNLMGFGAVVDLKAHNEFFADVVDNIPNYFCFRQVVMWFARIAYLSAPREQVKFTFDMNSKTNASSVELYDYLANSSEWEHSSYLVKELSFTDRNSVGIQVVDIVAREAMKHCDNFFTGPVKRQGRKSLQVLSATGRFHFDFYSRDYWADKKQKFELIEEKVGFTRNDYAQWLFNNKLQDNAFNRHKFLIYLDASEKRKGK